MLRPLRPRISRGISGFGSTATSATRPPTAGTSPSRRRSPGRGRRDKPGRTGRCAWTLGGRRRGPLAHLGDCNRGEERLQTGRRRRRGMLSALVASTRRPRVCFVALNAYGALSGRKGFEHIGGAEVQQVTVARGLAGRFDVVVRRRRPRPAGRRGLRRDHRLQGVRARSRPARAPLRPSAPDRAVARARAGRRGRLLPAHGGGDHGDRRGVLPPPPRLRLRHRGALRLPPARAAVPAPGTRTGCTATGCAAPTASSSRRTSSRS